MPIQIRVSDTAYQEKLITLNRQRLFLTVTYNTRDTRWYFDLSDRYGEDIVAGVKILPDQNLTGKYIQTRELIGGALYCVNIKPSSSVPLSRENLGTDKQYQLWYLSDVEIEELTDELNI